MILYLAGHQYRFAMEEGVVSFTGYRPDRTEEVGARFAPPEGDCILTRLTCSGGVATASALVRMGGGSARGMSRAAVGDMSDYDRARAESHALKIALYKALTGLRGEPLPWGSLSGMRPAKLAARMIAELGSPAAARRALEKRYMVSRERARLAVDAAVCGIEEREALPQGAVGLYVGVPFCPTRCAYCSFVSASVEKRGQLVEPYTEALIGEIERRGELCRSLGLRVDTLYIGGGTPTTLSAGQLDRVLTALEQRFDLSALREYTVEAGRPDTIDSEKLAVLRGHGVGRVSVNPQSMRAEVLARAGRPHSPEDIEQAVELARRAGFECINMDLIAGLPADRADWFEESVRRVIALEPENITVHTLALKHGAELAEGEAPSYERLRRSDAPEEETVCEMVERGSALLAGAGYQPYYLYRQKYMAAGLENVGWTRPGFRSIYNVCIMEELCGIIALGCGGVSKVMLPDGGLKRMANPKNPEQYISRGVAVWNDVDRKMARLITEGAPARPDRIDRQRQREKEKDIQAE